MDRRLHGAGGLDGCRVNAGEAATSIERVLREAVTSRIRAPQSRTSNWASSLPDPCDRRLVLWRIAGEAAKPLEDEVLFSLEEGLAEEAEFVRFAEASGIRIFREPPASVARWASLNIAGKADFWIGPPDGNGRAILAEHKAPRFQHIYDAIEDQRSVAESSLPHVRRWGAQLNTYLLLAEQEEGLLLIKEPGRRRWKILAWSLDFDLGEKVAAQAQRVNEVVERVRGAATMETVLPRPIDDPRECPRCPFYQRACVPNLSAPPIAELLADEEIACTLDRIETLRPAVEESSALERALAKKTRPILERMAAAALEAGQRSSRGFLPGGWSVETWWQKGKKLILTDEEREAHTVEDPRASLRKEFSRSAI